MNSHSISDDSGFLGLINTEAYAGFVAEDWDFPMIRAHFLKSMRSYSLLLWGTGMEGNWMVSIDQAPPSDFRAVTEGFIIVGSRGLHLINYEDLSMAAQFRDISLPLQHNAQLAFTISPGKFKVTIYRTNASPSKSVPHFVINLLSVSEVGKPWNEIPWRST